MNAIADMMRNLAADQRAEADKCAARLADIASEAMLVQSEVGLVAHIQRLTAQLDEVRDARVMRAWLEGQRAEYESAAAACNRMAAEHEAAFAPRPAAVAVADALPPVDDIGGPSEPLPFNVVDAPPETVAAITGAPLVDPRHERREALDALTAEAIEAGSYGEPAPVDMGAVLDEIDGDVGGPDFGPDCCADCGSRLGSGHLDGCPQVLFPDVPADRRAETLTQAVVPVVTRDEPAEPAEHVDYGALRGKHVVIRYRDGGWEDGTLTSYDRDRLYLNDQPTGAERALILRVELADKLVATSGPSMTIPDTGLAPAPLPPAEEADGPRHEKPKPEPDTSASTRSGAFRSLMERAGLVEPKGNGDDQDGAPSDG